MADMFGHIIQQLRIEETKVDALRDELSATRRELADERARADGLQAARIAYASEFPYNNEGEPDVGNIHANIRALKEKLNELKLNHCIKCGSSVIPCYHVKNNVSPDVSNIVLSNKLTATAIELLDAKKEIEELKQIIDAAPHGPYCAAEYGIYLDSALQWQSYPRDKIDLKYCNCWKDGLLDQLDKKEKV